MHVLLVADICHILTDVTICEPDLHVKTDVGSATPNDPLYSQQWNMKAINVAKAWAQGQTGDPKQQVPCCAVAASTDMWSQ